MAASDTALEVTAPSAVSEETKGPRNRFVVSIATILSAQVGRALITLLLEVVYARLLGPAGRGQLSLCLMVFSCGVLVGGLGGDIPIMLWSGDRKQRVSEWLPSIIVSGLLGSMLAAGVWVFLYWYWHPAFLRGITTPLAFLLLGSIPFSIVGTYSLALFVGLDLLRERSVVVVLNQFVNLVAAGALLYFLRPTAEMAFVGFLIGVIVTLLVMAWHFKSYIRIYETDRNNGMQWLKRVGAALSLGVRGQLGNVATFFNYRLDVFVVNYYLNTTQVGLYALGVMVSEALWQIPNAAAMALIPRTVRSTDDSGAAFTCLVCRQVFLVACMMAVCIAAFGRWMIPLIFGNKFGPSVPVIYWILPGTVFLAVAKVMCADLLARGMPEYATMFAFVSLGVTVALDLILIPRMGIEGAALASTLAYLTNSLLVASVFKRKSKVSWSDMYVPTRTELWLYRQGLGRLISWLRPKLAT